MKKSKKMERLLGRMMAIGRVELGKLCQMTARPHYSHQTRSDGRNVVRYVRKEEVPELEKDITGYNLFIKLAEQYTDEVIAQHAAKEKKSEGKNKIMKL